MFRKRLNARVDAAVRRAARKFSPDVVCVSGSDSFHVDAALALGDLDSIDGAVVQKGRLAFSLESFDALRRRVDDVYAVSFTCGGDVWKLTPGAPVAPAPVDGLVSVYVYTAIRAR